MQLPKGYEISPMQAHEVDTLRGWAASEGWNPGLNDLNIVWELAPESFIALRKGADLIGGGSIMNYQGTFGFMGLFILRADHRGQGLGTALWHWRRDTLLGRLAPGASIAMDGVFDMVPFYQRGGFEPAYDVLRYQGMAQGASKDGVRHLSDSDFEDVIAYDQSVACISRSALLQKWITQPGAYAVGSWQGDTLTGYGIARPCEAGFKIGPLFADTRRDAQHITSGLMSAFEGQQVQIDIPEPNTKGVAWLEEMEFKKVFGCTRLYLGPPLALPLQKIYSVMSLEFG